MPQALAAAAQAAAAAAASAAAAAGAGATLQTLAALAAYTATYVAAAAAGTAITSALAPDAPKPEQIKASKRQPRPPRVSGNGTARLGIAYVLFEASANFSYDVGAVHDGLTQGPTGRFWLNDDEAFIDGSGWVVGFGGKRYTPNHVKFQTRNGLPTETAYSEVVAALPSIWTNDHRGDGIASLAMICNHADAKYFSEDFPNGLPIPSAEWDMSLVYDPRDDDQDPADPSTWSFTGPSGDQGRNPALCLLWYLCFAEGGPQLDYARRVAPVVSYWIEAANVCDELVPLKAGGFEPRYRMGGAWTWDSSPSSIIRNYRDTFDGWLSPDGNGRLIVYAGKYYEPPESDTITATTAYQLRRFTNDEDSVNEFVISFVSADHAYNQVETDPWRDETDIAERGTVSSTSLQLFWVQSNGQARRLAKRAMAQQNATAAGSIRTYLDGLDLMGKRFLRIRLPQEVPTLHDIIVEVEKAELDVTGLGVVFTWKRADPLIDAWNPELEEGDGVDTPGVLAPVYAPVPTITDVIPFYEAISGGAIGVRLQVITDQPVSADLLYAVRWRRTGGVSYEVGSPQEEIAIAGGSYITTSFVPADDDVEVQVAAVAGSGSYTEWSATATANTSTDSVAPSPPDSLAAADGVGQSVITWHNPNSANFYASRLRRGTTAVFGASTPIGSDRLAAAGSIDSYTDTGLAPGTYYYWVVAKNAAGATSAPDGPDSAVVT